MAFVAALPYIMQGASLLGGIIGRKKKKFVDPEYLRQHYGVSALAQRTQEMANYLLNSDYGRQLMASAAEQGQSFASEMAARAAESGLSPDTGGQSGASDFAVAAGSQAQSGLERGVRSDLYKASISPAERMLDVERQAYVDKFTGEQNQPSRWEQIGQVASGVATMFPTGGGTTAPAAAGATGLEGSAPMSGARAAQINALGVQPTTAFIMPKPFVQSTVSPLTFGARDASALNPAQRMVQPRRTGRR